MNLELENLILGKFIHRKTCLVTIQILQQKRPFVSTIKPSWSKPGDSSNQGRPVYGWAVSKRILNPCGGRLWQRYKVLEIQRAFFKIYPTFIEKMFGKRSWCWKSGSSFAIWKKAKLINTISAKSKLPIITFTFTTNPSHIPLLVLDIRVKFEKGKHWKFRWSFKI